MSYIGLFLELLTRCTSRWRGSLLSMALKSPISGHRVHLWYRTCSIVGVGDQTDFNGTPRKVVLVYH